MRTLKTIFLKLLNNTPYLVIILLLFYIFNNTPQPPLRKSKGTIVVDKPKPIKVVKYDKKKLKKFKTEAQKIDHLTEELSTKVYKETYKDENATIIITDTVSGILHSQRVDYDIKPIVRKPKFVLSVGMGVSLNANNQQIYGFLGMKNSKGYELQIGMDTQKTIYIGLKKDIFTR